MDHRVFEIVQIYWYQGKRKNRVRKANSVQESVQVPTTVQVFSARILIGRVKHKRKIMNDGTRVESEEILSTF